MIDGTKPGLNLSPGIVGWRFKYFGAMAGAVRTKLENAVLATPVVSLTRLPMENGPVVYIPALSISLWKYNFHTELAIILGAIDPIKHAAVMQAILGQQAAMQNLASKLRQQGASFDDGAILNGGDPVAGGPSGPQ